MREGPLASFIKPVAAEDDFDAMSKKQGTAETSSLQDDDLAHEIGLNAHDYLEECFYSEVAVLDRDKFHAVPEIVKSNLIIGVSAATLKYLWRSDRIRATDPLILPIATVHRQAAPRKRVLQ